MPTPRPKMNPKRSPRSTSSSRDKATGIDAVWEEIVACNQLLRREMGRVLETEDMFLSEYRALRTLENGPCVLGQVGRQLGLTPATLTTLARGLERRGWARQGPSSKDRRASVLVVTGPGLRALRMARRATRQRLRGLEAGMDRAGSAQLARSLRSLRMTLERAEQEAR